MMQKWEYKVDCLSGAGIARMQHILNRYGQEGWELVGFAEDEFILKRPIPPIVQVVKIGGAGTIMGSVLTPDDTQPLASVSVTGA